MFHFQKNSIRFTLTNICSFETKIIDAKRKDVKIKSSEKCNYSESIPLDYLLSTYHCLHLWRRKHYMVINEKEIKYIYINFKLDIC